MKYILLVICSLAPANGTPKNYEIKIATKPLVKWKKATKYYWSEVDIFQASMV